MRWNIQIVIEVLMLVLSLFQIVRLLSLLLPNSNSVCLSITLSHLHVELY